MMCVHQRNGVTCNSESTFVSGIEFVIPELFVISDTCINKNQSNNDAVEKEKYFHSVSSREGPALGTEPLEESVA